jgi:Triose-phosphate Transporter family
MMVLAVCRYNKKALKAFPYPLTCTAIQFGIGSLMALTMWALRLHERPKLEEDTVGDEIAHLWAGADAAACLCCHHAPCSTPISGADHRRSWTLLVRSVNFVFPFCSSKTSARWRWCTRRATHSQTSAWAGWRCPSPTPSRWASPNVAQSQIQLVQAAPVRHACTAKSACRPSGLCITRAGGEGQA